MSFCMYRTYDISTRSFRLTTNLQLHEYFSEEKIFDLSFHIILYHLFYQQSQFKIIFFLYLGPKLFRFWLQPVVENHNHFEKMMMLSFLAYEIRTDDRVYVKFIFKYISEFFTAILIN